MITPVSFLQSKFKFQHSKVHIFQYSCKLLQPTTARIVNYKHIFSRFILSECYSNGFGSDLQMDIQFFDFAGISFHFGSQTQIKSVIQILHCKIPKRLGRDEIQSYVK